MLRLERVLYIIPSQYLNYIYSNMMNKGFLSNQNIKIKTTTVHSLSYLGSWCTLGKLAGMRYLYSLWFCLRGWDSLVSRAWCQAKVQLALKDGSNIYNNISKTWLSSTLHAKFRQKRTKYSDNVIADIKERIEINLSPNFWNDKGIADHYDNQVNQCHKLSLMF